MVLRMLEPIVRAGAHTLRRELTLACAAFLTRGWTRLYTAMAPLEEKMDRRAELLSDLHEHISDSRAKGVGPEAIALQVLSRNLRGAPDDLKWSAPYFSTAISERLKGWAATGNRARTLTRGILQVLPPGALHLRKGAQACINIFGSSNSGGNMIVNILSLFIVACGMGVLVAGAGLTLGGFLLIQRSAEVIGLFIAAIGVAGLLMGGRYVIEGGRQLR